MANIRTGSIVADIRGKVGSEIYSRNKGGAFVKSYASPVQPGTTPQLNAQADFAQAVSEWALLSQEDQQRWNVYADQIKRPGSLGNLRTISGRSLFIQRKFNLLTYGTDETPQPLSYTYAPVVSVGLSYSNSLNRFNAVISSVGTSGLFVGILKFSPPKSGGTTSINSCRFSKVITTNDLTTNLAVPRFSYESVFGSLAGPAGRKVFLRMRVIKWHNGVKAGVLQWSGQEIGSNVYASCVLPSIT